MPPSSAHPDDTPLMQQWRDAKSKHRDALIFFRVGDFYELFHDDAKEASRLLGLTLTARNNGAAAQVPMAGVPAKALDEYLARLVRTGRRAAICEQVEDASEAKGIVRREVVETVTPGTALADTLLQERRNNYLVAVVPGALAALDLSTGEFHLQPLAEGGSGSATLAAELGRLEPAELLLPRSAEGRFGADGRMGDEGGRGPGGAPLTFRDDAYFDLEAGDQGLRRRFGLASLDALGLGPGDAPLVRAAGALVQYVHETQPAAADHIQRPRIVRPGAEMVLDEMTRRNLELVEPLRAGEAGGTLVEVLDETVTAMGARLLRRWILRPLVHPGAIWPGTRPWPSSWRVANSGPPSGPSSRPSATWSGWRERSAPVASPPGSSWRWGAPSTACRPWPAPAPPPRATSCASSPWSSIPSRTWRKGSRGALADDPPGDASRRAG
jgi:DNA mismatch repair protein MutS